MRGFKSFCYLVVVLAVLLITGYGTAFAQVDPDVTPQFPGVDIASDTLTPEIVARLHDEAEALMPEESLAKPAGVVPMRTMAAALSPFDGYQLLDEISGFDYWQLYTPSGNPVLTRQVVASPFGPPAGGAAFYQGVVGNTYSWCNTYHISREFNFGRSYLPGSKIGLFLNCVRTCSSCYYDFAGVIIYAVPTGAPPFNVNQWNANYACWVGTDGGYIRGTRRTTVLPNGYSGFLEIPITWMTQPFDRVVVFMTNYCCHGNNYSYLDHIMFNGIAPFEVLSVNSIPQTLWLDDSGRGSGVVFRATTTDTGTVNFKIQTPSGTIIPIGSTSAVQNGSEYVAKLSWWGQPGLPEGIYTIIAEAGTTSKSSTFEVKHTDVELIGLGKWMKNTKDPAAVLPAFAELEVCPTQPWEELLSIQGWTFSAIAVGDPVNTSSGNLSVPEVDFTIKDRRSFAVARIYNSLEPEIGSFGRGWSSPLLVNLEITDDYVVFTNSDGSRLLFNRTGASFVSAAPTDLKLEYNADTEFYTLSHPTGATWIFNNNGQIVQMLRSCCGQGASDAIIFSYDASDKLAQVSTPSGKNITFTFDANDLIAAITDSAGRTYTYTYDDDKNLISVADPLNRATTYSYDESGFMVSYTKPGNKTTEITYFENRVTSIKDPAGAQSTFAWDLDNRKLSLTDFAGIIHEYAFDEEWRMCSYSVPSANLSKEFSATDGRIAEIKDSLNHSDHYSYDENGLYQSHTDKLGNVTTFTWHPTFKKLTSKTDSLGRTWSYEWCSRGNLITQIDPAGHETAYTYDSHNNRTSKTDALGHITRYIYDSTGNYLVQTIDAMGGISSFTYDVRGNLTSSTDQLGRTTSYEYDLINRLTKSTYPDGRFTQISYDAAGNIASRIDNLGRVTAYTYDANGKLLTTTRPDGTVLSHAYDAAGRKISSTDALNRVTSYEYDALDNMVKVTYPDQTYQTYVYDTEKRLISNTDELGNVTAYEYDPMGRMLATIDPAGSRYENQYDAAGRKVAAKDPLGRITAYEHDVLDRVVKTTAPDLTTNTAIYDAVGNLLVSTNALNQQTVYEYDALNRQVKTTQPNGAQFSTSYDVAGQVISGTDALGNLTVNAYDNAGRRTSTTNALNHVWQYVYDAAGRLVRTVDPMNGIATMTYNVMDRVVTESDTIGRVTAYEYDASGKRIARTDALGRRSLYGYDARDRLTAEVDAEGRMVSHGYDAAGRKISLTDGAGRIWRWVYDSLGRVTAEIDPLGNEVKSSYDAVGNLTLKTNARAQATGYEYDLMNRLVKIDYPDSTEATFSYDALGRELVRSGIAGTVAKSYDTVGNLLSETFVNQNKGWSCSYDLMGNRIQAISPENETFTYRYDNLYRLTELASGKASEKINYTYDALGRNIEEKRIDSTTANTFDAAGQLLEMKHCSNADTSKILALRQYSYDLAGNRISMTDESGNITAYSYDNSNWLTKAAYPNGDVVAYTYNGAGDRLSEQLNQDAAVTYSYDAAGRMIGKGSEAFEYDADGNMLNDNTSFYTWNSDNRLIQVEKTLEGCKHDKYQGYGYGHLKHGRTIVAYENYDYLPNDWRRIARKFTRYIPLNNGKGNDNTTTEQSTFYSVYDGNDESHEYILSEVAANKNEPVHNELKLVREFVNGPGTDDIEYTRYGVTSLAMLKDGLGSIIALTGPEAQTVARIGYNAWGEFMWSGDEEGAPCSVDQLGTYLERMQNTRNFGKIAHNGWNFGRHFASELSPYLYTARRYSDFTGQYYNRHRFYSPALGRFISKDPIGFNGGNNLYRYADNNPMLFTDPFGLKIILTSGNTQVYEAARNLLVTAGFGEYLTLMDNFKYNINLNISNDHNFVLGGFERGNCTPLIQDWKKIAELKIENQGQIDCGKDIGEWISAKDSNVNIFLGSKNKMKFFRPENDAAFVAHELLHEGLHALDFHEFEFNHPRIYIEQLSVRVKLHSLNLLYDPKFDRYREDRKITGPQNSDF